MPDTQEQERAALKRMADCLAAGGRIVIGADEPVPAGVTVLKDGERHLVVKRRATREEFLETADGDSSHIHAAFYYELELWDRVIERADGERLGIRIRQVGR